MKFYTKEELKTSRIFFDRQPANYLRYLGYFLVVLILVALIATKFIKKNYVVQGVGTVEASDRMYVTPLVNGSIEQIVKNEGNKVKAGDVLLKISTGTNKAQSNALDTEIQVLKSNIPIYDKYQKSLHEKTNYMKDSGSEQVYYDNVSYYLEQMSSDSSSTDAKDKNIAAQKQELSDLQKQIDVAQKQGEDDYTKQSNRYQQDLTAAQSQVEKDQKEIKNATDDATKQSLQSQLQSDQNNVQTVQRNMEDLKESIDNNTQSVIIPLQSQMDSLNQSIGSLETQNFDQNQSVLQQLLNALKSERDNNQQKIEDLQAQLSVSQVSDGLVNVTADKSGSIHYLSYIKNGLGLQAFQPVAQIDNGKNSSLMVETYISAQDRVKIKVGNPVKIALSGVNEVKYGLLKGTVESIGDGTITQTNATSTQTLYELNVKLSGDVLKSGNDKITASASMPVTTSIVYDKESYLAWILQQLDFTKK